jgi:glycosyltransferase involved in cell wall biosynthesis
MTKDYPTISVVIPTFNGEGRISDCLESIIRQDYSKEKIEILVVDDDSTDGTVEVARRYGAKILTNGHRNIERGKSIGLEQANNELILLLDDDNRLSSTDWLTTCVEAMLDNPEAVGAEAIYFSYDKNDPPANRYCSLFGINDAVAFYLNKRDRLMATERCWNLSGKVLRDDEDYFLVEFEEDNLPTVGSQGFLTRRELLLQTNYKPYLFHIDSNLELVKSGHNKYLMMKLDIIHKHSDTMGHLLGKANRNMTLFLQQANLRTYKWKTSRLRLILAVITMFTVIKPLYDSLRGFIRKPDIAWFLHPVLSFVTVFTYGSIMAGWYIKQICKFTKRESRRI